MGGGLRGCFATVGSAGVDANQNGPFSWFSSNLIDMLDTNCILYNTCQRHSYVFDITFFMPT